LSKVLPEIASSVPLILPQLNLTELKLTFLKSDFKCEKENKDINTLDENLLHYSSSTFFKFKSSFILNAAMLLHLVKFIAITWLEV